MSQTKILCVIGTRPEAIKMAPIILALKKASWAKITVLVTAQHREMVDEVLNFFSIHADIDFDLMKPNQSLSELAASILKEFDGFLDEFMPDIVIAQGDTTTVMGVALGCFHRKVPFYHVEAGLRTFDTSCPFPEELNRVLCSRIATMHFAPTETTKKNLLREGIHGDNILVTGNTVIDSLFIAASLDTVLPIHLDATEKLILITAHRRENFGEPLREICRAILDLAVANKNVKFLYPVHPNPNVRAVVTGFLKNVSNIVLTDPLSYPVFVAAMKRCHFIISDSGGIQEEAPALNKPVLVLRNETERPEALECGLIELVGTNYQKIIGSAQCLLDNHDHYSSMARGISPYGDGFAANKIVDAIRVRIGSMVTPKN